MANTNRTKYTKEDVLTAIKKSNGIMSTIAARLKCDWHTADKLVKRWNETIKAMADETEAVVDIAEGKLIQSIINGDAASCKWYLSKKGKHRGYGDEVTQNIAIDKETPSLHIIIDDENTPNCPVD